MTSIYKIEFDDIKEFLKCNNKCYKNKTHAYTVALNLLKNKDVIYTTKILDYITARSLYINNVNIPKYSIYDINLASQDEINILSNSLNIKDINSVKNVLKYLGKLDEKITFLPEINKLIMEKYIGLLQNDILSSDLSKVVNIFKNHRFLREFIYNNIKSIVEDTMELEFHNVTIRYYGSDFIFDLVQINETFLAKKVLELYGVYSPTSDAILLCSREYLRRYV
jgi:hypothetical protein